MATATERTEITIASDVDVQVTRTFDAPREVVFDAYTLPEHLPHWMLGPEGWTMTKCDADLRTGGAWRYEWRRADGSELSIGGTFEEVSRPERLVSTESWGDDWPEIVNTLVLTESGGKTTLTLTMTFPSKDARDKGLATGMNDGMDQSFNRLDTYLAKLA